MSGPPDKWSKLQVSTTADSNAQSSSNILSGLNTNFPFNGSVTVVCSDGTFVFVGAYAP